MPNRPATKVRGKENDCDKGQDEIGFKLPFFCNLEAKAEYLSGIGQLALDFRYVFLEFGGSRAKRAEPVLFELECVAACWNIGSMMQ